MTSWSRVRNSDSIAAEIRQIISKFHPADPAASVSDLLKLRQAMNEINDESWIPEKKAELDKIVAACLGLHVEASTANETFTPGQTATIKLEAINRSNIPVTLQEVRFPNTGDSIKIDAALPVAMRQGSGAITRFRASAGRPGSWARSRSWPIVMPRSSSAWCCRAQRDVLVTIPRMASIVFGFG